MRETRGKEKRERRDEKRLGADSPRLYIMIHEHAYGARNMFSV